MRKLSMQKKTKSILEELDNFYIEKDKNHLVESRASNIIQSAINLLKTIESLYPKDQSEDLERKFLNAIRHKDPKRFVRSLKRKENDD